MDVSPPGATGLVAPETAAADETPINAPSAVTEPPRDDRRVIVAVALLVAIGAFLRVWALGRGTITSDQAVVGLMAHNILHGHFFAFYWGQNYGGGEPYVVAVVFAIFGQSAFTLGLTPVLLDATAAVLIVLLGRRLFSLRVGAFAALCFWVWSEVYVWQSTVEYGFRWLALVCGLSVAVLALHISDEPAPRRGLSWALLGLFAGVGWWSTPEIAYYLIPALLLLGYRMIRGRAPRTVSGPAIAVVTFFVGALPWIWANLRSNFASLHSGPSPDPSFFSHDKMLALHALPMVLGLQLWSPVYDLNGPGRWVFGTHVGEALTVIVCLAGAFWLLVLLLSRRAGYLVLFLVAFPVFWGLSPFTWYWLDGRYAIFLPPMVALLLASGIDNVGQLLARRASKPGLRVVPAGLTVLVLLALTGWAADNRHPFQPDNTAGSAAVNWTSWMSDPNAEAAQLAAGLEADHADVVYAGYWVSYVLDFEARGRIVATDARYSRYPPYRAEVEADPHAGWLFVQSARRARAGIFFQSDVLDPGCASAANHCLVADEFTRYLDRMKIAYRERNVGDFVLVQPARAVDPDAVFRYFHVIGVSSS